VTGFEIRRVPDDEVDGDEEWVLVTEEEHILGVGVVRRSHDPWPWTVFVSVMEFIREQPLEGELERSLTEALSSVPGVNEVLRDDREVWIVSGSPSGPDLARAAAAVVDSLAGQARLYIDEHLRGR
jgi:hypothetical protein